MAMMVGRRLDKIRQRAGKTRQHYEEKGRKALLDKTKANRKRLKKWIEDEEKQQQACNEVENMLDKALERAPDPEEDADEEIGEDTIVEAISRMQGMWGDIEVIKETIESDEELSDEEIERFNEIVDYLSDKAIEHIEGM